MKNIFLFVIVSTIFIACADDTSYKSQNKVLKDQILGLLNKENKKNITIDSLELLLGRHRMWLSECERIRVKTNKKKNAVIDSLNKIIESKKNGK